LHSNCLASLANMGSSFANLHPYVAQRIVDFFEALLKKFEKLREELYPSTRSKAPLVPITDGATPPTPEQLEMKVSHEKKRAFRLQNRSQRCLPYTVLVPAS